ncbi:LPS assembly lipoprotein LptE [Herbaspirillum sp. WKF16]|uniref:LPS-assembly lipoprotein LptE n=1 Tax=Herbaspirillum sp. WKF16 TaxID=3028312 RepID=UPI0023AA0E63|nr:LPS assembly lipoprotein LptE [Herbaspirillum sp. WKF16]WDZ96776.1 LPS assembly lipoprotein LptE [Herbaspirillum sp. WKF16]
MHSFRHSKRALQWLAMLAACLTLAACGFHLRGAADLPFKTIYMDFAPNSPVGVELKRNLAASGAQVVDDRDGAEANLKVLNDTRGNQVLTLNTNGRVREYALFQYFTFSVSDAKGAVIIPPTAITLRRVITYDENQALAKQSEEALLYRDMQSDLVQQILRRLSASKSALATEKSATDGND